MKDDPRERIETERPNGIQWRHDDPRLHVKTENLRTWDVLSIGTVGWPEVVAFARAILAADEAWKDANVPTFQGLRTKYPGVNFGYERIQCGPTFCDVAWIDRHPFKVEGEHFESEAAALRWLAATLAETEEPK